MELLLNDFILVQNTGDVVLHLEKCCTAGGGAVGVKCDTGGVYGLWRLGGGGLRIFLGGMLVDVGGYCDKFLSKRIIRNGG